MVKVQCAWCGRDLYRYPSQLKNFSRSFCCSSCRSQFLSKRTNPTGYVRHNHLSEFNRAHNKDRMTPEVRRKPSETRFGTGKGEGYLKLQGRHLHRTIAEQKIGRPLRQGEIVHHIDGNKRNNSPENLEVLENQREHFLIHKQRWESKGGDAV